MTLVSVPEHVFESHPKLFQIHNNKAIGYTNAIICNLLRVQRKTFENVQNKFQLFRCNDI